jgi:PEGA domain-containing protein
MVMASDPKSNPNKATPVAVDDVRATEVTPPGEEPPEKRDSLMMFPSERTTTGAADVPAFEIDFADHPRRAQPPRPVTHVPVSIVDDRATRDAIRKLGEYSDTLKSLQELCASIDDRLRRAEEVTADRTLHELSARVEARLSEVEQAVQRIERTVASESLEGQAAIQVLRSHISERLEQTEEIVRRSEGVIADHAVREVSACIDARVTGSEEVVRRIEQVVSSQSRQELSALQALRADIDRRRVFEHSPLPMPPRSQRVMKGLAAAGVLVAIAILVFVMKVPIAGEPQPELRAGGREVIVRDAVVDAPAQPVPVPPPAPTTPTPAAATTPTPTPTPTRPPAQSRQAAAPRRAAQTPTRRATVPAAAENVAPRSFVGDLTITSTPAGATVSINGRAAGVTPLVLRERPAGSVAVQIANDGFERWSASVQVRAGEMTNVSATLRRAQ